MTEDAAPWAEDWRDVFRGGVSTAEELARRFDLDVESLRRIEKEFPFRINRYYLSLIESKDDPIWKQVVPDIEELQGEIGYDDPLAEESDSPILNLTHRYPDRVLFYINHQCPIYCRFCTRKRKVGDPHSLPKEEIDRGIQYIRDHPEIRDIVVSGGDALMLSDQRIDEILGKLRAIPHVEILRVATRVPCALPQRVTSELCAVLKKHHPLYINTHFNHPREVTPEAEKACGMLADAGIPLGCQTVLLRGVNDDPATMKELMQRLLRIRVKPYYIYQADLVQGTDHFRTSVRRGLEIIQALRGHTSGMAVPHFVIDAPGGGGKIALLPDAVVEWNDQEIVLRNYEGNIYRYPNVPEELASPVIPQSSLVRFDAR
ncbi:KamA family radical SAM protein [Candidatus Poribacteria bacterium]|nr:KamA family radical SAM protein [Candidatus Poribacteria bacterium]